jgi:hypothetical protein
MGTLRQSVLVRACPRPNFLDALLTQEYRLEALTKSVLVRACPRPNFLGAL